MVICRNLLVILGIAVCLFTGALAYAQPLCQVVLPKRFAKLRSFPVNVVVQLSPEARPETFQASLNNKDITSMFKECDDGLQTVIGPKDGLRINVKTVPPRKVNVLKISVEDLESQYYAEFETFFFVEVDRLVTLGPEGGTIQSVDGRLSIDVPQNALPSTMAMSLTRVYGPGRITPTYQPAPVGVLFNRPVSVTMKYDPNRVPAGVMQDDLFLVLGKAFPRRMQNSVVDKTAKTVTGTVTSFSRIFMSYYLTIGKELADIPLTTDFRLPIGDDSSTHYTCGQEYKAPPEYDLGETVGLLHRSLYSPSGEPRIIFNGNEPARAWQVTTAFNRQCSSDAPSGPLTGSRGLCAEGESVFNNGEDWQFLGYGSDRRNLPIHAIADGLVIYNGWGYGKAIVLAHRIPAGPVLSVYSHMGEKSHCAVGTVVRKGNVIGKTGRVGEGNGYLHFEIGKQSLIRVNPETGEIKVPATWLGQWQQDSVYEHYYDPTNFLLNMMGKYKWRFDVNGNDEGWVAINAKKYESGYKYRVSDGVLAVTPASSRVRIESYPLNLSTGSFDSVFITMKSDAPNGHVEVYFATGEEPRYSEDKAVGFEMVNGGDMEEYRAFMAENPKWKGTIIGVRIDIENMEVGETTEVGFVNIRLGRAYLSQTPDTGQTKCYDDVQEIVCPASDARFHGQDGHYAIRSPSYEIKTIDGDEIVIDHVTGLSWQKEDNGVKRTWPEAMAYCENLTFAGYSGWRLPTRKELQSIANYGGFSPTVDTTYFLDSHGPDGFYWSATTQAFLSLSAWGVCFWDGQANMRSKEEHNYVRAVRGRPLEFGHFRDNGDGTVTDVTTGLMWQQTETKAMNWEKALAYCENLDLAGYSDWRLPNIRELITLVHDVGHNPSINVAYFLGCRPSGYWSSTTNALYPSFGWYVGFRDGEVHGGGEKGRRHYVRAVRNVE